MTEGKEINRENKKREMQKQEIQEKYICKKKKKIKRV